MLAGPLRVSAVVLANNQGSDPTACLRALLAGTVTPHEVILVTQNDSAEGVGPATEHVAFKHVHTRRVATWAEACNLGLEHATGDLIAVLDARCEVRSHWLETLVTFLGAHTDTAAVEGKRYLCAQDATPSVSSRFAGHVEVDVGALTWVVQEDTADRPREVACLSRHAFLIRRTALEELGKNPLDGRFESELAASDLFARLLERRWRLYYIGEAEANCTQDPVEARGKEPRAVYLRELLLFAWKHLSSEQRDHRMALVSAQAKLRIRDLFATLDPAVLAAREAIAWIREREWQLVSERAKGPAQSGAFQVAADAAQSRARYFYYVRQEILDLVPASAKVVVDVGCASGALGAGLKRQRPGVEVRGVEISPEAAALAREVLDDVYCGSADASPPSAWPRPDCVIFADVLEHLQDPWSVLRTYRALLGVGGKVVVSVPNIGHRTVIAGLLRGKFEYADAGILDRSHLRFFTKASAIDLLEGTGFKVEQVTLLEDLPTKPRWIQLAQLLRLRSAFLDDFQAVQFLILATAV